MNKKGQIITLDFLVSIAAVTLAIGLLIQFSEVETYRQGEEMQWAELKAIAENASNALVSRPDIVCELVENDAGTASDSDDDTRIGPLNNCLPNIAIPTLGGGLAWPPDLTKPPWSAPGQVKKRQFVEKKMITKEKLGIPSSGYSCLIELDKGGLAGNDKLLVIDCLDSPGPAENIYAISREIVVFQPQDDATVNKAQLETCMQGITGCELEQGTITIRVWKT